MCCLTNGVCYLVCNTQYAHRAEIPVYFMSAQRWVLGGNSTTLAHLITIRSHIYTVKNVS